MIDTPKQQTPANQKPLYLRTKAIGTLLLHGSSLFIIFCMHSFLGNRVNTDGYGVFTFSLDIANILATIALLGWTTSLVRFIAEYSEESKWGYLRGVLKRAHQIVIISAFLLAGILFATFYLFDLTQRADVHIAFIVIILPILVLIKLRSKIFQGFQHVQISIFLESNLLPILVISVVWFLGIQNITDVFNVYIGVGLLVVGVGSLYLWRIIPQIVRSAAPEFSTQHWLQVSLPMMFGNASQMTINRTGVLLLGLMTNMSTVGLFSAALRLSSLIAVVLTAINLFALPRLAAAFYGKRLGEFRSIFRQAVLWSVLGAIPLFGVIFIWPERALGLFGSDFRVASGTLRILAIGYLFSAFTGPVGPTLQVVGGERLFARVLILMTVFYALGNVIAIPVWGIHGTAVVTTVTLILRNGLLYYYLFQNYLRPNSIPST